MDQTAASMVETFNAKVCVFFTLSCKVVDPDPHGSGSRRAKMTYKYSKKIKGF
jgi:hypothetical protein